MDAWQSRDHNAPRHWPSLFCRPSANHGKVAILINNQPHLINSDLLMTACGGGGMRPAEITNNFYKLNFREENKPCKVCICCAEILAIFD